MAEIKVSAMTFLSSVPDDAKIYVVVPGDTTPYYTTKADLLAGISAGFFPDGSSIADWTLMVDAGEFYFYRNDGTVNQLKLRIESDRISFFDDAGNQKFYIKKPSSGVSQLLAPATSIEETIATREWIGLQGFITNVLTALGFTPENSANKVTTMTGNTSSNTVFLTAKAVYDWVTGLGYQTASQVTSAITSALTGYATQAWVNSQGFITNVVTALGFTPANAANTSKLITSKYTGVSTGTTESVIGFKQVGNAGNGSSFLIYALANMGKSNGSNSGTIKFYLNTVNDLTGSPIQIGINSATSALSIPIERTYIYSGGVLYGFNATTNAPTDRANGTAAELALTIDLVSTTYFLIATVQTSNAATTVNSRALEVSINPNVS